MMINEMPAVILRPVTAEDEDFLCSVYGSTREEELAQVPWDATQREAFIKFQYAAQLNHYRTEYPQAEHSIVLRDGQPVGRLYVDRRDREIHVLDITLLTQSRSQGLGAPVIRALMDEAAQAGQRVSINLDGFSQSHSLFERLGFKPSETTGFHTLFVWNSTRSDGDQVNS